MKKDRIVMSQRELQRVRVLASVQEEQLRGEQDPTHVGFALRDLGVVPIRALSPQAKGRVERLFRTLQDRLTAEMRLEGIDSIETVNPWLEEVFLPRFNARFANVKHTRQGTF